MEKTDENNSTETSKCTSLVIYKEQTGHQNIKYLDDVQIFYTSCHMLKIDLEPICDFSEIENLSEQIEIESMDLKKLRARKGLTFKHEIVEGSWEKDKMFQQEDPDNLLEDEKKLYNLKKSKLVITLSSRKQSNKNEDFGQVHIPVIQKCVKQGGMDKTLVTLAFKIEQK